MFDGEDQTANAREPVMSQLKIFESDSWKKEHNQLASLYKLK
jgi:hypothetical protein